MAGGQRFSDQVLERWRDEREVLVETSGPGSPAHRTIIWIVVDDAGRALVRSYRGATARWYREAIGARQGAIVIGEDRVPVRFEPAADEGVAACSRELARKYAGDPATAAMLRDEVLDTTLELLPNDP